MPARMFDNPSVGDGTKNGPINEISELYCSDEVIISGISGRLPESNNIAEFRENLINGIDMITEDDRRWKPGKSSSNTHFNHVCMGHTYFVEMDFFL